MKEKEIVKKYKTGDKFTARIDGYYCEGKIYISETKNVYFCQNYYNGEDCNNKLGFEYSWVFDDDVTDITITPQDSINNQYEIY